MKKFKIHVYPILIVVELLICINALDSTINFDVPYVKTPLGGIKGYFRTSWKNRQYAAFEGVPYAQAPTGDLRFQPPVPISAYKEEINATSLPPKCSQYAAGTKSIEGKEDCLYLNIYVPVIRETKGPLPVIFWIHWGGFQYGYGGMFRAKYIMDKDVILVTINYRVGMLGFMSTGDHIVPGNMGLKDQNMALRWVNENIHNFNGNPEWITLAGISAGAASVHFHYLSPMSTGLFRNGISFSGTALNMWAYTDDNSNMTRTIGRKLGCSMMKSESLVRCLKNVSAKEIHLAEQELQNEHFFVTALFPPVSEPIETGYFLNKSPKEIIENGQINNAPWIVGCVSDEGLFKTAGFIPDEKKMSYIDKNWNSLSQYALDYMYNRPASEFSRYAELTRKYYLGSQSINTNKEVARNFTLLVGDYVIKVPVVKAAKLQAKANKGPVYFYHYTYRATDSLTDFLTNSKENYGVCHCDDVLLVLENDFVNPQKSNKDKLMLSYMLDNWYSIANTGKPNLGVSWPKMDASSKDFEYMHIANPGNFKMEIDNNFGNIKFWSSIGL